MIRFIVFLFIISFNFDILPYSFSNEKFTTQKEKMDDKIAHLQKQYDNLQKYIFNLQYTKGKEQAGGNLDISQFADQIRLLRKDIEELKKEMDLLRINVNHHNNDIDKKIDELQNTLSEREYDAKFLNIIDNELNAYSNLKSNGLEQNQGFVDTIRLKEEEEKYDKIMHMIDDKDYKQATRELKKFIVEHPNSILASNVFFYLGEIAFKEKDYTLAAIHYFKGYQVNRNGERSISNLVMLSKSMIKIGKYTTACKVIQHIEYNFADIPTLIKRNINDMRISARCSS